MASAADAAQQKTSPRRGAPIAKDPSADTNSVENLTASARESVVVITQSGRGGKEEGVGAGFVISEDGLIATAMHVVGEGRALRVQLASGRSCEVTGVHASDRKLDLAILRVDASGLRALKLGDSDNLKQGAPVIAIGNPLGLAHSVVQGVVSARRDFDGIEMIQLAIPIEPGNSGGPLLDMKGRVQGILTLKSAVTRNLGFAMPVNLLKTLLDRPNPVPMTRWLTLDSLRPTEWTPLFGAQWRKRAGRIEVEGVGSGFGGRSLLLSQTTPPERPFEIAVSVKLDDESGAAGLVFASDGGDRHFGFYPSGGQLRLTRFNGPNVFSWTILKQVPSADYRPGGWNHLRVRIEKERLLCYVNGALTAQFEEELNAGRVGLAKFRETKAQFKNFEISTNLIEKAKLAELPDDLARRIRGLDGAADAALVKSLQAYAVAGPAALHERALQLERQAAQLRRAALTVHRQAMRDELREVLQGPDEKIDLFHAALLVARFDNADLDVKPYRRQLEQMGAELAAKLPTNATATAKLDALSQYLFAESGFHGSRTDYYNRANSYMNEVLDDREGLPITLSILFMEMAQRIGLTNIVGLPLPGHFMVGHRPNGEVDTIIDVFDGGKHVSRSAAQDRVIEATGRGFRDSDFRPATKQEIIVRMLRNLLAVAERSESAAESVRYLDLILALTPDSVDERLARVRILLQAGDASAAKEDLKWLIDHQPKGVDLDGLKELYQSL